MSGLSQQPDLTGLSTVVTSGICGLPQVVVEKKGNKKMSGIQSLQPSILIRLWYHALNFVPSNISKQHKST
jgi:hypothetical protein